MASSKDRQQDIRRGRRSYRALERGRGRFGHVYSALDLGTNNCRLLVARPTRNGFRVVDAFSRVVRLGEGLNHNGALCDAAMDRAISALKVCADKMDRSGVDRSRCVATEACRRAGNCSDFLDRVNEETGLAVETITTEEEARLAIHGCVPLLDNQRPYALVFDIGGGSTQVIWLSLTGSQPEILAWLSVPMGVVTVSERYSDLRLPVAGYSDVMGEVDGFLTPFCKLHGIGREIAAGKVQMVGTSGTVTTLTGIHLDLPRYDRSRVDGAFLDFDVVHSISDELRCMPCARRAEVPCIGDERADLVVAGCAILEAITRRWPVGKLRVADRGVREGILVELIQAADAAERQHRHGRTPASR